MEVICVPSAETAQNKWHMISCAGFLEALVRIPNKYNGMNFMQVPHCNPHDFMLQERAFKWPVLLEQIWDERRSWVTAQFGDYRSFYNKMRTIPFLKSRLVYCQWLQMQDEWPRHRTLLMQWNIRLLYDAECKGYTSQSKTLSKQQMCCRTVNAALEICVCIQCKNGV